MSATRPSCAPWRPSSPHPRASASPAAFADRRPSFFPELTAKLVEWGITSVSVSPDVINHTRRIVYEVESAQAADAAKA